MRQELPFPQDVVYAEMKDYMETVSPGLRWELSWHEEPGIIDLTFSHEKFGDLGKVRLLKRTQDKTLLESFYPLNPSNNDVLELIEQRKVSVDLNGPIAPLVIIHQKEKEMGVKNYKPVDDFRRAYSGDLKLDLGIDLGPNATEELQAAYTELENLRRKIYQNRLSTHQEIIDAIMSDLRLAGIWTETIAGQKQEADVTQKKVTAEKIEHEHARLTSDIGQFPSSEKEKPISHGGRRSEYSQDERDKAVKAWLNKDKNDARTLLVFLVDKFGEKDDSSFDPRPIVSPSCFYLWRSDYLKRHPPKKR
jgi:hypothetical protein